VVGFKKILGSRSKSLWILCMEHSKFTHGHEAIMIILQSFLSDCKKFFWHIYSSFG